MTRAGKLPFPPKLKKIKPDNKARYFKRQKKQKKKLATGKKKSAAK